MNTNKPHIRLLNDNRWVCYNSNFREAYNCVIYGVGESVKEAYEDWLINAHLVLSFGEHINYMGVESIWTKTN